MTEKLLELIYKSQNVKNAKSDMSALQADKAAFEIDQKSIFSTESAERILEDVLSNYLEDSIIYDSTKCAELCVKLSAEIRDRIKQLNFERYKIVTIVQICEKKKQGLLSMARMLCDIECDRYALLSKETPTFLTVACVFGIHLD